MFNIILCKIYIILTCIIRSDNMLDKVSVNFDRLNEALRSFSPERTLLRWGKECFTTPINVITYIGLGALRFTQTLIQSSQGLDTTDN